ncbi:MAG: glycoside hydrolase [Kiritimatiellales bacterium]|nr:glycoside hydrolase [Kiritimatiellales bacterium]
MMNRNGLWTIFLTVGLLGAAFSEVISDSLLNGFKHPSVIFNPGEKYNAEARKYQGIPTIERAPGGRLWAAWYAGPIHENRYNFVMAATSGDGGQTWSGLKLFSDRRYVAANVPAVLDGSRFLCVSIENKKQAVCTRAGMVYMLIPQPDRNRDSQTKVLIGQGFRKVALAEVPLFSPKNQGNYSTLYQKECAPGEVVTFGKWAVPVFFK